MTQLHCTVSVASHRVQYVRARVQQLSVRLFLNRTRNPYFHMLERLLVIESFKIATPSIRAFD